ncbi:MAG: molybdopterin-dependent oxidoreductase [Candidatus Thermoplasmatota archaeon]|nr:molybdopterin-dependent oxidoreductase [Candidatus Thermoplasmatota archaeon]
MYVFNACPRDCYDTCAIVTRVRNGRLHSIDANDKQPFTHGFLCPKGEGLIRYVYSKQRVLHPMKRVGEKGEGKFKRISWDEALGTIAEQISKRSTEFGTDSILQFDYAGTMGYIQRYFPSRFFNAIGASRVTHTICSRAGDTALELVWGSSLGMLPEEIERCRLIVVWGMNPAWSSPHGYEIIKRAQKRGAKVYIIDPIRTQTAELGTHLQIRPTTDAALALGCINHIIANRLYHDDFVQTKTTGFDRLADISRKYDLNEMARVTGLKLREMEDFIADYVSLRPNCIMIGFGMQRNRNGGDMVRAISILPALIGERRGFFYSTDLCDFDMDYLEGASLTSRRKVHYNMVDIGRTLEQGRIKMMFVYNSNPLATLPNQPLVRRGMASEKLFTVVHDLFMTDTADYADIVLPATSTFEHLDLHASYFHQFLTINEKAIEPLGEAKSNSDLFRALAATMGLTTKELFEDDEKIARTLVSKSKSVDGTFQGLKKKGFVKLKVPNRSVFRTPSRAIELYSARAAEEGLGGTPAHVEVQSKLPYQLITPVHRLLVRSQYHTEHPDIQPVVYINKRDAADEELEDGGTIKLANEMGDWTVGVEISDIVPRGVLLSYSALWPKLSGGKNVNFLTTDYVQRYGGNSAFNSTFVRIA